MEKIRHGTVLQRKKLVTHIDRKGFLYGNVFI